MLIGFLLILNVLINLSTASVCTERTNKTIKELNTELIKFIKDDADKVKFCQSL